MRSPNLIRYTGWAAIMSGAATLLMVIAAILSSAVNLGDTFKVLVMALMALMILVALALHLLLRTEAPALSVVAAAIGILSMLVYGVLQALLLASVLTYEQISLANIAASAGVGIWLLLVNYAALRGKVFPSGLAWAGLIAGAGFLVLVFGFLIYPIWAIWLGRWLLAKPHSEVHVTQLGQVEIVGWVHQGKNRSNHK